MPIQGSLDEAGLPDVLQLLTLSAKTGCIDVTSGTLRGEIYLENGLIVFAAITSRRDRLPDMLQAAGRINRRQLDQMIVEQNKDRRQPAPFLLIQAGLVEPDDLPPFVQKQCEESVYFMFTWKEGEFAFNANRRPPRQSFLVALKAEPLLLEGGRRVDDWGLIKSKVPSFDLVFKSNITSFAAAAIPHLTDEQRRILPLLDGTRDLHEVMEQSGYEEFDVGKAVCGLVMAGLIQFADRRVVQRHLEARELLAYALKQGEFADGPRRKEAAAHVRDCASCTNRLRAVVRESQEMPALTATQEIVPPKPAPPRPIPKPAGAALVAAPLAPPPVTVPPTPIPAPVEDRAATRAAPAPPPVTVPPAPVPAPVEDRAATRAAPAPPPTFRPARKSRVPMVAAAIIVLGGIGFGATRLMKSSAPPAPPPQIVATPVAPVEVAPAPTPVPAPRPAPVAPTAAPREDRAATRAAPAPSPATAPTRAATSERAAPAPAPEPPPPPPVEAAPDAGLATGGWSAIGRAEAVELLGGGLALIPGLRVETITTSSVRGTSRVRVAQLTRTGERVVLIQTGGGGEATSGAPVASGVSVETLENESIGSATLGSIQITARSALAAAELRRLLQRLNHVTR